MNIQRVGKRRLAGAAAFVLLISLISVVALPALAHTPVVTHDCNGLSVDLTAYVTGGPNSVKVTIDGVVEEDIADFGSDYSEDFLWDSSLDHTYTVEVVAWDDPNGTNGWTDTWTDSQQACNPPTTSSTTTSSTTTSSTTTSSTTTTTAGATTTTAGATTTTAGATTTTAGATTTTAGATTTTAGATTTTASTSTTGNNPTTTGQNPTTTTTSTTVPTGNTPPSSDTSVDSAVVSGIQATAPVVAQVTQATLPFTGLPTTTMAAAAAGLAALGALLLSATRKTEEKDSARSWN